MPEFYDLTVPISTGHWRYPNKKEPCSQISKGDSANKTYFDLQSHWFTHIDAPKHHVDSGKTLNEFPLDIYVGKAAVLDVSYVQPNEAITAEKLEKAFQKCSTSERLLIKTSWGNKRDWTSKEFWDEAPYITKDGAEYLKSLKPRLVGFDFPQDYDLRQLRFGKKGSELDLTTHDVLLANNILMIEYMNFMWKFDAVDVDFYGLPLNLTETDGAQIRVLVSC